MNELLFNASGELPHSALIEQAQAAQNLMTRYMARRMHNCLATGRLAPHLLQTDTWEDLLQMQSAIARRLQQQNDEWVKGCTNLIEDFSGLKRANTMTKLLEQQFNLLGQFSQLVSNQTVNMMALQENIDVDFGYWVSQKLESA